MALIAFRRGRDQAGRWKDGRLQEEPQAAPLPGPAADAGAADAGAADAGAADAGAADAGAEARSFYESLIAEGEAAERAPGAAEPRPSSPQFCRSCGSAFRDPPARHRRSTAHLLAAGLAAPPAPPEPLRIPPSNRGYRLLLRGGWRGGGLGRAERGRLLPVPTELKRDRGGLGWRRERPRVTHFGPGDVAAVAGPPARRGGGAAAGRGESERGSRRRFRSEAAERAWEIRLREYMERWDPPEPPPRRAGRRETPETP